MWGGMSRAAAIRNLRNHRPRNVKSFPGLWRHYKRHKFSEINPTTRKWGSQGRFRDRRGIRAIINRPRGSMSSRGGTTGRKEKKKMSARKSKGSSGGRYIYQLPTDGYTTHARHRMSGICVGGGRSIRRRGQGRTISNTSGAISNIFREPLLNQKK